MGRPKGSKNKKTLEREAEAQALATKVETAFISSAVVDGKLPLDPVHAIVLQHAVGPALPREQVEQAYNDAVARAAKTLDHYRVKALAPHTEEKLRKILTAQDIITLDKLLKKAEDSVFMWCLGEWALGRSPGPKRELDAYTALTQADKADKLAAFLEKKGLKDNAISQRERAMELRQAAKDLTEQAK